MNRIAQPDLYRVWGGMSSAKGGAVDSMQHLLVNQFTLDVLQSIIDNHRPAGCPDWMRAERKLPGGLGLLPAVT